MWFFYALTFAFLSSIGTIIAKRIMQEMDEYSYIFVGSLFSLPALLMIILIFYQIPKVNGIFYLSMAGSIVLDIFAAILAFKAIRISEISLINPISAFNPVFTAVISFFVLKETITPKGWLGILLIIAGAYLLRVSESKKGIFAPFKALALHKGVRMALGAYFIWSITPIFQKTAILNTFPQVPPFASLIGTLGVTLAFTPLVIKKSKNVGRNVRKFLWIFVLGAILTGIAQTSAFMAFSLAKLGFVTAIFKLSMIFTVIFGWLFFREKDIKERLLGSLVMLAGVILLVT